MVENRSRKWRPYAVALVVVAILAALIFAGLPRGPQFLYPEEVRDYEGEDLSSLVDLYDNAIQGTQDLNNSAYRLSVTGLVDRPLQLSYSDVVGGYQNYLKVITLYCVEGWNAKILWEGILVRDLLQSASANMTAPVVIFRASDGYSTALPIRYLVDNNILLAYKMNGLTIPIEKGYPLMLAAETQWGYKWIKWITQIEVSDNADYHGYWESRGYPNNATIG
jgi:DMSO/TMAO reductase YedYZ molybdopterin-dependent catalytic subunit